MNEKKEKFYSDLNYYKKFTIDLFRDKLLQFKLSKTNTLEITDRNISLVFPYTVYDNIQEKYVVYTEIIHYISITNGNIIIHCLSSKVLPIINLNIDTLYQIMYALFEEKKDIFELKD